jgi:hypothetical protein
LEELKESYVGRLAVNVEVYRIRTILFMEGYAHISVTEMGRNLVLIHSPKKGEIEKLWRSRVDWITYYFREVFPWAPACFANRRDTWVKVFGIPLHVWGENLFKVLGGKYGEFLDFDNKTASRAKLDVACLKISTNFRGKIDDQVQIKAMGVVYTLRVVEDETVELGFHHGERFQDEERSWVESVNCPEARQVVVDDGSRGGTVEDDGDGAGEDFLPQSNHVHEVQNLSDGDGSKQLRGIRQNQLSEAGGICVVSSGNLSPKATVGGNFSVELEEIGVSQGIKVFSSDKGGENEDCSVRMMETCPLDVGVDLTGGEQACEGAFIVNQDQFVASEPVELLNRTRSASLQPNRITGPPLLVGRTKNDGLDYSDSISLVEERRGFPENEIVQRSIHIAEPKEIMRRGRSRKHRDKSKHANHSKVGLPKFVQLGEVLKEGAGRLRRRKKDGGEGTVSEKVLGEGGEVDRELQPPAIDAEAASVSAEGLLLEVVLPAISNTPISGLQLLHNDTYFEGTRQRNSDALEATKILQIQQKVGFSYKENEIDVVKALDSDVQRDREKKKEWEQKRGFQ